MKAEEYLKEKIFIDYEIPIPMVGLGIAKEYARLFAIEQLNDLYGRIDNMTYDRTLIKRKIEMQIKSLTP